MRRYWISRHNYNGESVLIEGEKFHHIFDVCRQEKGSKFEVIFGDGKAYVVEVEKVLKKEAICTVIDQRTIPELPKPYIHLCLSLPKISTLESVLEKSVELGVKSFTPFVSEFSFAKSLKGYEKKYERWGRIVESATQQSGRGDLMDLNPVISLAESLEKFNRLPNAMGLFPYEGTCEMSLADVLPAEARELSEVVVFVGSEGGYSEAEVKQFQRFGLQPFSLGDQILRVETACVALTSVIKYELDLIH